ncbi:MAG: DUF1972 domain-containing protein [Terracidiphilus sp.]
MFWNEDNKSVTLAAIVKLGIMRLLILGTRGIPAKHGGFETFAEDLAYYLTTRGHHVAVYCQGEHNSEVYVDEWRGITLIHFPSHSGAVGTVEFDIYCALDALKRKGLILTLGYNTAVLSVLYRLFGRTQVLNMDGIEWKRAKWSTFARLWLRINEYAGAMLANHLVADHPAIREHHLRHVKPAKISMIPYGATCEATNWEPESRLSQYKLNPRSYALVIARTEPENSILEIVQAYSSKKRGMPLVILGEYDKNRPYHAKVMDAASNEVFFVGAIYDREVVKMLRNYAKVYIHGHRVGGTNPSLIESLASGNAVIAHDNPFTRWVAGEGAKFFRSGEELSGILDNIFVDESLLEAMRRSSIQRHADYFTQLAALQSYEELLERFARP